MTVTLQDIAMITSLPIKGNPFCMSTNYNGWRKQMHALIGVVPLEPREPEVEDKKKERVAVSAPFTWTAWNFGSCPEDANEDEVKTYARVYMCWMKPVVGPQRTEVLVVVCSHFLYGAVSDCRLDDQRLDRTRQRKIKEWDRHHRKYIIQFALSVEQAKAGKRSQLREHYPITFNNYLTWFLASTRVEICKLTYDQEIFGRAHSL
ncbi:uncharacterized protein [Aegilops tauschii subsp. strangulata]|uniref:uncharacterized protein n=1 Tax=Aegilops tauschii subsp. strangulata TaxID=200361 RepID=UPI003CC83FA0